MRSCIGLLLLGIASIVTASEPETGILHITLRETQRDQNVSAKAALLIDNTTIVHGSGLYRRFRNVGAETTYLMVTTGRVSCETTGEFNSNAFLTSGSTPDLKIPEGDPSDFTLVMTRRARYSAEPKQRGNTVLVSDASAALRDQSVESELVKLAAARLQGEHVVEIHFHAGLLLVMSGGRTYRPSRLASTFYAAAGGTVAAADNKLTFHFDPPERSLSAAPGELATRIATLPDGMFVLRRDGDKSYRVSVNVTTADFTARGEIPLVVCEPMKRTVGE